MVNKICVLGQGYVGLPLAMFLARNYTVIGFDIDSKRISDLNEGIDRNNEYSSDTLLNSKVFFEDNIKTAFLNADFVIVTVPTPITDGNRPDLAPLESASKMISDNYQMFGRRKPIIVFESTVYPGATEEVCVPLIENKNFKQGKDFFIGYSPERVNPGDQVNTIDKITKVVSGENEEILNIIDQVYSSFTKTHRASSIKVAEAAKVIENSQRDLNIAFVNELALIFDKLGIDTLDVLEAAGTKWNFLPFRPGLVGGHCQKGNEFITIKQNGRIIHDTFENIVAHNTFKSAVVDGVELLEPISNIETLSFNPFKEEFTFEPVSVLSKRPYNKMVKFETSLHNKLTTSDKHPHIVKENGKYIVKLASELKVGDEIPIATQLPIIYNNTNINIINIIKSNLEVVERVRVVIKNDEWKNYGHLLTKPKIGVKPSNFKNGNYLPLKHYLKIRDEFTLEVNEEKLILQTGRGPGVAPFPAMFPINEQTARLIGYYLSEGCLVIEKEKRGYQSFKTMISISSEELELEKDIKDILNNLGVRFSVYKDPNFKSQTIKVCHRLLGELLLHLGCGRNSYDVKIPDVFMFNSDKIRGEVLRGILLGDGGFSVSGQSGVFSFYSASDILFQQVLLLMHNIKVFPVLQNSRENLFCIHRKEELKNLVDMVSDRKKERLESYFKNGQKIFGKHKYHIEDDLCITKIEKLERFEEKNEVYSMEVPTTENYVTTGGVFTHNCISVDPYYLTHKAEVSGILSQVILAGRKINDSMAHHVVELVTRGLNNKKKSINGSSILVLGATFKENCKDTRNSKIVDVVKELKDLGADVRIHDPYFEREEIPGFDGEHGINFPTSGTLEFDAIVYAVDHADYHDWDIHDLRSMHWNDAESVIVDLKGRFGKHKDVIRL